MHKKETSSRISCSGKWYIQILELLLTLLSEDYHSITATGTSCNTLKTTES